MDRWSADWPTGWRRRPGRQDLDRFNLRQGVLTFATASRFGADDVIESLQLHVAEGAKSAAQPIVAAISEMKKTGEHQVQFTLEAGNADFPYLMSDYHLLMYPAGQIEEAIAKGIGTGLYEVTSFEPGVRMTARRVASHYKGDSAGFFDELEYIAINDSTARMNALMTGQVDAINRIDFKTEALLKANPMIRIQEVTGNQHYTFPMLTKVDPFTDVNVRRALKYGINRQELALDKILLGHGMVGNDTPVGPANQYFNSEMEPLTYDMDKAKFYLKEAGLTELNIDLNVSNAAFNGAVDAAQLYQASAKGAGININVVQEPADGYWSNVWLKKPFCASYFSGRATEDWMFATAYEAGVPWNDTQWDEPRFQELLLSARAELDSNKRREMYFRDAADPAGRWRGHHPDVRQLCSSDFQQGRQWRYRRESLADGQWPDGRTVVDGVSPSIRNRIAPPSWRGVLLL